MDKLSEYHNKIEPVGVLLSLVSNTDVPYCGYGLGLYIWDQVTANMSKQEKESFLERTVSEEKIDWEDLKQRIKSDKHGENFLRLCSRLGIRYSIIEDGYAELGKDIEELDNILPPFS